MKIVWFSWLSKVYTVWSHRCMQVTETLGCLGYISSCHYIRTKISLSHSRFKSCFTSLSLFFIKNIVRQLFFFPSSFFYGSFTIRKLSDPHRASCYTRGWNFLSGHSVPGCASSSSCVSPLVASVVHMSACLQQDRWFADGNEFWRNVRDRRSKRKFGDDEDGRMRMP